MVVSSIKFRRREGRKREGRGKKREELMKESGLLILVRFPLGFEQCCPTKEGNVELGVPLVLSEILHDISSQA